MRVEAEHINRQYYGQVRAGQRDYWKKMAAPRFRVRTLLSLLSPLTSGAVVDLGCGDGSLLRALRTQNPKLTLAGIDLSEAQIDVNRQEDRSVQWRVMDLDQTGAVPEDLRGRFDAVLASEVIEHVENPEVFLSSARALARPQGGRLLLSTQSGPIGETERRVGHRRHFSLTEMERLLGETGWTPVRVWNCGYPFHDWSKRMANIFPDRTMRQFGEKSYGVWQNLVCGGLRAMFFLNSSSRGAQLFAVAERT